MGQKRKKWFSAAIIRKEIDGEIVVLLQKNVSISGRYRPKIGFPGGMRSRLDQTPERTAIRETREETYLKLKEGSSSLSEFTIFQYGQTKHFSLFNDSDFDGDLRKRLILDGDSKLFPPYWATIPEALVVLSPAHREGLIKVLEFLGLMG